MRGRRWLAPLLLFVGLMVAYVPTAADGYVNPDAYASSLASWRIATTGEPWMENVAFSELSGIANTRRWQGVAENGHLVAQRMYGPILAAVPFYWVGSYGEESQFTAYRGGLAAATCVALAILLLFLAMRRYTGDLIAAVGSLAVGLGTPAWSIGANALWTHPMTMLGMAGAAWGASRDRWVLAGIGFGVGIWARPHLALSAAVLGLAMAYRQRNPRIAVAVGIPSALSMAGLTAWNRYVFGMWNPLGAYAEHEVAATVPAGPYGQGSASLLENLMGFLVSPDRGMLVWTPLLVVLFPSVVRAWRHLPAWTRWTALAGVAYTIVQLGLNTFMGGDGFYGYRHGLELLVALAPAYVLAWPHAGRAARRVMPALLGLQAAAIALGAVSEVFLLNYRFTWTDNSFFYAWRTEPLLFSIYIALFVLIAVLAGRALGNRPRGTAPPESKREEPRTAALASGPQSRRLR